VPVKVIFLDVQGVLDIQGYRNSPLVALLEELKQQNDLKIIITTNTSLDQSNDPQGLTAIAELVVNSTPDTPKPSIEFWNDSFRHGLSLVPGLQMDEVLVIDDRSDIIESARDFGFQTLHYIQGASENSLREMLSLDTEERTTTLSSPKEVDQYFEKL